MVMQCNVSLICWMETMSNTMSTMSTCHRNSHSHRHSNKCFAIKVQRVNLDHDRTEYQVQAKLIQTRRNYSRQSNPIRNVIKSNRKPQPYLSSSFL